MHPTVYMGQCGPSLQRSILYIWVSVGQVYRCQYCIYGSLWAKSTDVNTVYGTGTGSVVSWNWSRSQLELVAYWGDRTLECMWTVSHGSSSEFRISIRIMLNDVATQPPMGLVNRLPLVCAWGYKQALCTINGCGVWRGSMVWSLVWIPARAKQAYRLLSSCWPAWLPCG